MTYSMLILAAGLPLIGLLMIVQRRVPRTSAVRSSTEGAIRTINTNSNPFRIGGNCTIIEDTTRPELNWDGTVIATRGHYMTVRDNAAPYNTVDLEKSYVFPYGFTA